MVESTQKVTWDDIKDTAKEVFNVWVLQSEINWAKEAWAILEQAGITSYSTEIERQEKLIYFLALAGIYLDFCCVAFEECIEYDYLEWTSSLGIEMAAFSKYKIIDFIKFIEQELIQMDRSVTFSIENFEENKKYFFEENLQEIVDESRRVIFPKILNGFGGEPGLFVSLYKTTINEYNHDNRDNDDDDYEDDYETDEEILNDLTNNKLEAYNWITEGCFPYSS
jgi:hypothetical protein